MRPSYPVQPITNCDVCWLRHKLLTPWSTARHPSEPSCWEFHLSQCQCRNNWSTQHHCHTQLNNRPINSVTISAPIQFHTINTIQDNSNKACNSRNKQTQQTKELSNQRFAVAYKLRGHWFHWWQTLWAILPSSSSHLQPPPAPSRPQQCNGS